MLDEKRHNAWLENHGMILLWRDKGFYFILAWQRQAVAVRLRPLPR